MISEIKPSTKKNELNVMAVTHAVYIAQLIGYLYEDLKCRKPPGDIRIINGIIDLKTTMISNTSIATFDIEVDNFSKKIKSCNGNLFNSDTHIHSPKPALTLPLTQQSTLVT